MIQKIKFRQTNFLILVKDQEFFSKKLVSHINNQNIDAELIIADGSKKKQNKIFNKLKVKKKRYYYFGEDTNLTTLFQKIHKSLKKTEKKFIFFCDQDDLINFETIKKKEDFLLNNNDYSAAKGTLYNFNYINKKKIRLMDKTYSNFRDFNFFFLRHLLNINFRSYYCLHRRKNLIKIFNLIVKYKIKDFRSAEFIMDFITISAGRIKFLKDVSALRWAGVKDNVKIHPINEVHSNRYIWFKYFFTNKRSLINKILIKNKTIFNNFYFFKIYIFIFDICINLIVKNYLRFKTKIY